MSRLFAGLQTWSMTVEDTLAVNPAFLTGADPRYLPTITIDTRTGDGGLHRNPPRAITVKLAFDVACAAALLLILSPLMLLIALLIRCDGGPVFFAQERLMRGGRTFRCLKFRSMMVNSPTLLRELLLRDEEAAREWAETQKLRNDPRITWVGKYLRQTSLDELPQLFNILRGDMSLVGPRPIIQQEVARYAKHIESYNAVRPGLTGLWQVSGRSEASYEQRVQLDVAYVRNQSLLGDLVILAKTVPAVLARRGAY